MSLRIVLILCTIIHFCYLPFGEAASLINVPLNPDISDFNTETYRFIHRLLNKRVLSVCCARFSAVYAKTGRLFPHGCLSKTGKG